MACLVSPDVTDCQQISCGTFDVYEALKQALVLLRLPCPNIPKVKNIATGYQKLIPRNDIFMIPSLSLGVFSKMARSK